MQKVAPLMFGFRMQLCNLPALFLIPSGTGFLAGQFLLFLCKFRFHAAVWVRIFRGFPVAVHVQFRHEIIQTDAVIRIWCPGNVCFRVFHQDGVIPFFIRFLRNGHGFQFPTRLNLPVQFRRTGSLCFGSFSRPVDSSRRMLQLLICCKLVRAETAHTVKVSIAWSCLAGARSLESPRGE